MTKKRLLRIFVTGPARRDFAAILKRSAQEFGIDASIERLGSKERPELMIGGARTYHLSFSRTRVSSARVKDPVHFLLYRRHGDVIEVARILHHAREIERHVSEGLSPFGVTMLVLNCVNTYLY